MPDPQPLTRAEALAYVAERALECPSCRARLMLAHTVLRDAEGMHAPTPEAAHLGALVRTLRSRGVLALVTDAEAVRDLCGDGGAPIDAHLPPPERA